MATGKQKQAGSRSAGKTRAKPGSTGEGEYYHIEVRPKDEFVTFRTQDVGKKGGIQRVGGMRSSGSWDDQKWLISKEHAHVENGRIVPDTEDAREALEALGSIPVHITGDRFKAKPRSAATTADRQKTPKAKKAHAGHRS
ncbi:MAG: hypothetical protein J2P41_03530 [Blastocatellia bacterium]|nr:hypothetical protein [Blastocatellia bacterium]